MALPLRERKPLTCILLLSIPPPLFLPRVCPPPLLPTLTQDNHPKARFSIKFVTLFHSRRAIHGINHISHSNTKLFFDSPVRGITARTGTNTHLTHTLLFCSTINECLCRHSAFQAYIVADRGFKYVNRKH